jgi:hypothetical protein
VEPRGTEWGLAPLKIGPTKEGVSSDPLVCREHDPKATARSAEAVGSGVPAEVHGDAGVAVEDASRTSEADGPEPWAPQRRRARRRRKAERALRGRANGTGGPSEPGGDRQGMHAPDAKGEVVRRLRKPCVMAKGGEHGHELKIRRPGGHARLRAQAPVSPLPLPLETARGWRDGAGRRPAKPQAYEIPGGFLAWETVPGTGRR